MTELDAVNDILRDLGEERPVSSLTGLTRVDAQTAHASLLQVSREFQTDGWWFNRQTVKLARNGSDQYVIPDNWVKVRYVSGGPTTGQYSATPQLVVRGNVLFDTANNTDVFASGAELTLKIVILLPFESLPSDARSFVYATASIRAQSRLLGSKQVDSELRDQARMANGRMQQQEIDAEDINLTTSGHFVQMMWDA